MKLKLGPEIISSYKRLAYHAWYALAEFVDNSTQAYFNNKRILDTEYATKDAKLRVEITAGKDIHGDYIKIKDNSIGMNQAELEAAVHIGKPPIDTRGRSRYGLGLKTGACWFGDLWTIDSKKLGNKVRHKITVDVLQVATGNLDLPHKKIQSPLGEHGTEIVIRRLHRKLNAVVLQKVKNYLRSLYRIDISRKETLELVVNGDVLSWDSDVDKRLLRKRDKTKAKVEFHFKVHGKSVSGWAGVLEKGTRRDAGFSIIQSDRVIMGWPESYRPKTLFGDQEGGSNDLVNQRLFGELVLDKFEVSHTKDQILFDDGEQEYLEVQLKGKLGGLRQLALSYRKGADERVMQATAPQRRAALNQLELEIQSDPIQDFFKTFELPSESLIKKTNDAIAEAILKRELPDLKTKFGKTSVSVYMASDMSPNDPYVIIESTKAAESVIVIINVSHPHWQRLTHPASMLNFIRDCTYDGVSESKAYSLRKKIEPNTVKLIKDNLLRLPLE